MTERLRDLSDGWDLPDRDPEVDRLIDEGRATRLPVRPHEMSDPEFRRWIFAMRVRPRHPSFDAKFWWPDLLTLPDPDSGEKGGGA